MRSICATSFERGNINLSEFMRSTAWRNANSWLSSDGWNIPPKKYKFQGNADFIKINKNAQIQLYVNVWMNGWMCWYETGKLTQTITKANHIRLLVQLLTRFHSSHLRASYKKKKLKNQYFLLKIQIHVLRWKNNQNLPILITSGKARENFNKLHKIVSSANCLSSMKCILFLFPFDSIFDLNFSFILILALNFYLF